MSERFATKRYRVLHAIATSLLFRYVHRILHRHDACVLCRVVWWRLTDLDWPKPKAEDGSEPRTEAGRNMLHWLGSLQRPGTYAIEDAILAIEAEASAPWPETLALVEGVRERHSRMNSRTLYCTHCRHPWPCPDRRAVANFLGAKAKAEAGRTG